MRVDASLTSDSLSPMQHELLDAQNDMHALAKVTAEELPGYAEWVAEWESQQEQDWGLNICE